MKTKNKLSAILLMCAAMAGARGIVPTLSESGNIKPRNVENLSTSSVAEPKDTAEKMDKADPFENLAQKSVSMRTADGKKERLDSVVGYNADGSKSIRMYCEYGSDGLMTKQTNSYWNSDTESWDHVQVFEYAWDEDGYCTYQSNYAYGSGERVDYQYNADKLCTEQIKYIAGADGVWQQYFKGQYTYDSKGNMVTENCFQWENDQWREYLRSTATYDENNLLSGIETYECVNGVWRGQDKHEYVNFSAKKLSSKLMYRWDDAESKWIKAQNFIQEWSQNGILLAQRNRYWNEDKQDWVGEYPSWGTNICRNYDAELSYDEKWRMTRQAHTDWYDMGNDKHLAAEMVTVWTDNEDGTSNSEMNSYLYSHDDGSTRWDQRQYKKFDANDSIIWNNQQIQKFGSTEMLDEYESKYAYDEQGHCIYSATWKFKNGERRPDIEQRDIYDTQGNIIEQYFRHDEKSSTTRPIGAPKKRVPEITDEDKEGWVNSTHFTYGYEDGVRVSKLRYVWNVDNSEWYPNTGTVTKYDLAVPASELILPITYLDEYKILQFDKCSKTGTTEWAIAPQFYFYSGVNSSVENIKVGDSGALRFADRTLYVSGACNDCTHHIYDPTGRPVLEARGTTVDLGDLAPGFYIVSSVLDGNPATLRILCK